jgi:hypothetical protein
MPGQPEHRVGTDAPAPMDNFADTRREREDHEPAY